MLSPCLSVLEAQQQQPWLPLTWSSAPQVPGEGLRVKRKVDRGPGSLWVWWQEQRGGAV